MYILIVNKNKTAPIERTLFISGLKYNCYMANDNLNFYFDHYTIYEIITKNKTEIKKITNIIKIYNIEHKIFNDIHSVRSILNDVKSSLSSYSSNNSFIILTNITIKYFIIKNMINHEYTEYKSFKNILIQELHQYIY